MPPAAIAIVMIAAVTHASWNALARKTDDPYAFFFALNLLSIGIWLPVAMVAGWDEALSATDFLLVTISGSLQVIYFTTLAAAYRRGGVTLVYPIARGTGVAIVPVAAFLIFDERPTLFGWLGIGVTLLGIGLLGAGNLVQRRNPILDESRGAVIFAVLTGLVIATYSLFDNFGVERLNPVVYGYGLIVATVVIQAPFVILRRRDAVKAQLAGNLRAAIAGGFLVQGTYVLVLIALTLSNVGYVVPLRETSIVFAMCLGLFLLREPFSPLRAIAAAVVAFGAACIAIGG